MATWVDFKELRSKLKMADVLARYNVQLKVRGDRATGYCPLPSHKRNGDGKRHSPSFSCNLAKGIFQCFSGSCRAKGNSLDFACLMDGGDPNDSASLRKTALKLQEAFGLAASGRSEKRAPAELERKIVVPAEVVKPEPVSRVIVNAPLEFELKHLDPKHPYLASRGLNHGTIEHFGLGHCAKGMMAGRIAIPLHDAAGKLIGYAGRLVNDEKIDDENPKYRFPGTRERMGTTYEFRKSEFLYNANDQFARVIKEYDMRELIIVEGFPSVWHLAQLDRPNVVAVMGSSCSPTQADLIVQLVGPAGVISIMTDGDEAGEACTLDIFRRVAPRRACRWIKLDPGKQPTDLSGDKLKALLAFP